MSGAARETMSVVALLAVLVFAVARPHKLPEAVVAVPAAGLVVAVGAVSPSQVGSQLRSLLAVVAFLAAVLVIAHLCDGDGLFAAAGFAVARLCRGSPSRLLGGVFVVAATTTAALSLDATVVLLTPVVFATVARLRIRPQPHVYACTHLANTASLLLPVSNLTNLLAFSASGLSFTRFAALTSLAWVAAVAVEYGAFRWFFRGDLRTQATRPAGDGVRLPVFSLAVVVATLAGFVFTSLAGVAPAWAALGGALLLAVRALFRRKTTPLRVLGAANPLFLLFVLALGVVVKGVVDNGLDDALGRITPGGTALSTLLAIAAIAAVLANLINNLPAILALLPLVSHRGPGPVLAALVGVNLGPNLSYVGSLATLLWRRILHEHDTETALGSFTRLGLLTVPLTVSVGTVGVWAMLRITGG